LTDVSAVYHNTPEELVQIRGNITFDHVYILNGENGTEVPLYLSARANNSDDGNWNHIENITMKIGEQEEQKTVKINITNDDFYSFFLHEGRSKLRCNGVRCGCDDKICIDVRNKWKILDIEFNAEDKTFTLHLDANFDYEFLYLFQMDLSRFFKSALTLKFNIIRV
jgi:hypothetical protein